MRFEHDAVADQRTGDRTFVPALGDLRSVPPAVWAVNALFILLLVAWTNLTPLAQAPDEVSHGALIELLADGEPYPSYDGFYPYEGVVQVWLAHHPSRSVRTPDNAPDRDDRRTLEEWGGRSRWGVANQISQHPPLYYEVAATALRATRAVQGGDEQSLDREWQLLRLGNVVLVAPLPLIGWAATRLLGAGDTAATTAATFPLALPQLAHIGSAINNDNQLVLASGLLSIAVAAVLRGDLRQSTAVAVGLATGLALWTKAFAFVYLPWVAVAYVAQARARTERRRSAEALAIALATAMVTGAWWWIRNQVRYGEVSPSTLDASLYRQAPGFQPDTLSFLRTYLPSLIESFWADLTAFVTVPPGLIIAVSLAVFIAAIAAVAPDRVWPGVASKAVPARRMAAFASVIPMMGGALLFLDFDRWRFSSVHAFMQGRYMFGAIVPIAVVVGVGGTRLLRNWTPLTVLAVAFVMQLVGVGMVLRGLWAEPSASVARSLDAVVAWSPWPSTTLYALAVGLLASGLISVVMLRPTGVKRPMLDSS